MDSSQFSDSQPRFEGMEQIASHGATCDAYRVKIYGKLHFLKRLKPQYAGDIRFQEALRKEFETGYRLEHPNIVRYISLSGDSILMEYVDGETLSQRLNNHPEYFENKKNTEKFLRQLLDAVGYLHSHQVLHLDLKPDNILLTRINDDVKLIDLGCCYTDGFVDTHGFTESFAAPEQLSIIHCPLSIRTDIYAIGKIMELLPHHHIYNKVIGKCTAQLPENRYLSIADLQKALLPKRKPWRWALLALFLVIFFLGYLLFAKNDSHFSEPMESPVENKSIQEQPLPPVQSVPSATAKKNESTKEQQQTAPSALPPIKQELSEEELAFLDQPHLRTVTSEEFSRYKQRLADYYREANAFLNDSSNYRKYPSHQAYLRRYQDIVDETLQRIKADEWFHPLYNSPMNPISSYTRKYKADMEHRAFVNSNQLP
ncbi:MAG: protein kinase [Prevotella sp.]|nr:protein kinase [Prevotella sp.]